MIFRKENMNRLGILLVTTLMACGCNAATHVATQPPTPPIINTAVGNWVVNVPQLASLPNDSAGFTSPVIQLQTMIADLSDHPKPATDYHLKTGQRE
ncbi:MAG: hypothetical protein WA654_15380 [Candidatus Sulfotelmatobacter sp.]